LKRELERKSTNNEVNTNVFEEFKQKINEKTQRINELEKQLDSVTENRNQLTKRVDELLLQGYEPKK
jgi:septal ring factor EnvC (AmiA/AmiB activator)